MHLIQSPSSPYVRTIRVLVRETGLKQRVTEIDVSTSPMNPASQALAANPTGRIPALIRDEGPALFDSRVIARYLDHIAGANLYPETRLWEVLTLEALAQGIMDSAVGMAYEMRLRPAEKISQDWLEAQWAKVTGALDAIENTWQSHLHGPLTMAQIALGCALGYLDLRHGDRNWRNGRENLAAWDARFSQRPAMLDTAPPA